MSARKVGNHIYIEGTGNTLQSVCDDIADTAWMERTGSAGNYTFTVKGSGSTVKEFRIRRGGELTIGDPTDYSFQEHLVFAPTYNDRSRFYIDHGGTLYNYGNTEIVGSNNSYYTYFRWYGKNYWRGNATYRPLLTKTRRVYWYWNSRTTADYTHDIWDWDKVDVHDSWGSSTNTYQFYFTDVRHTPNHTFKDVDFDGKVGATTGQYLGYCAIYTAWAHAGEHHKITMDSCTFQHYYYGTFSYYQGVTFKDCTWKENKSYGHYCYGMDRPEFYDHTYNYGSVGKKGQWFDEVTGGTFTDNYWGSSSRRSTYHGASNVTIYKDCTFNESYQNIYATDMATPLIHTGNTFSATNYKQNSDTRAVCFWVQTLDLTVNDENGDPLEGATVTVRQKDGKEIWHFETDSNGKVVTKPTYQGKIYLVHTEQKTYNTTVHWSDSSNSTYHTVSVFKNGYRPDSQNIVMDADKSLVVQLDRIDSRAMVF